MSRGAPDRGGGKGGGRRKGRRTGKGRAGSKRPKRRGPVERPDPSDAEDAEVRYVQPYDATKAYLCPGCNQEIPLGMGHMVAVPPGDPDLRRHWHRGCWNNRRSRR